MVVKKGTSFDCDTLTYKRNQVPEGQCGSWALPALVLVVTVALVARAANLNLFKLNLLRVSLRVMVP